MLKFYPELSCRELVVLFITAHLSLLARVVLLLVMSSEVFSVLGSFKCYSNDIFSSVERLTHCLIDQIHVLSWRF